MNDQKPQKGWECPRCGIIHHPDTKLCFCPKRVELPTAPKAGPWRISGEADMRKEI